MLNVRFAPSSWPLATALLPPESGHYSVNERMAGILVDPQLSHVRKRLAA